MTDLRRFLRRALATVRPAKAEAELAREIGADLWHALFDENANVIGRTVRLGTTVHTIVGVLPQEYGFPANQNLWVPLTVQATDLKRGEGPYIQMFGRLKEGVSASAAQARLQAMLNADTSPSSSAAGLNAGAALRADVRPYLDSVLREDRNSVEVIVIHSVNVVFVMLLAICGANVATLVFARTATRGAEITVRSALGASRGRISAQLFAEALVLAAAAAVVGLTVARFVGLWVKQTIIEAAGKPRPFWWDDSLSPQTILYAFALALFSAVIVGLVPALKATGAQLQGRLRHVGAGASTMKFGNVWTTAMITHVAITVIFLSTVASFGWMRLRANLDYDVTFAREQFLAAKPVRLAEGGADVPIPQVAYRSLADRLSTHPAIVTVTYASELPEATESWCELEFATREVIAVGVEASGSRCQNVGPNYFETMGIQLVAGRLFTDGEAEGNRPVAIVDETFARLMLGGRSALGLMIRNPEGGDTSAPGPWHEIVGVVKDVSLMTRKAWSDATVYRPVSIDTVSRAVVLMRTHGAAAPVVPTLQAAQSANHDVRLVEVRSLDQTVTTTELLTRILLRFTTVTAGIALLLSTAGIYALISFTLTRRTREIGIRAALGAAPGRIVSSVLGRALAQVGAGILAGAVPGAMIMIFGIDDWGGMSIPAGVGATLVVCSFVIVVAAISCAAPLGRALRVDPTEALRLDV